MYQTFVKKYFLILFLGALLYAPIMIFLFKIQEITTIENIVKNQLAQNSIYGTALNEDTFAYKLELVKQTKPEIIAIGSSRVMQFRQEFFTKKFITTGGATNYINEGVEFLNGVLKVHKPKVIILGLDIWWFNDNFKQPSLYQHQGTTNSIFASKLYKPIIWLFNGKISINQFFEVVFNGDNRNKITNFQNIGIAALKTSDGFRKDGSYFYSKIIFGEEKNEDIKFQNTFERIRNGNSRFETGSQMSQKRWSDLEKFLAICQTNHIKVVIFAPPFANETIQKLTEQKLRYQYIDEFRKKVKAAGGYDYHDPAAINSNDCEFIDGFHGGDVTYQRILMDMALKNQTLKEYVNLDVLKKSIEQNSYKALSIFDADKNMYLKKEIDFLEIGCKKL